jgi:hypothetical protein
VPQQTKHFAKQLNKALDNIEAPSAIRERAIVLSKILDIPKQDAWALLEGQQLPSEALLQKTATELEVDVAWLLGNEADEE